MEMTKNIATVVNYHWLQSRKSAIVNYRLVSWSFPYVSKKQWILKAMWNEVELC